ncbi:antibiotic biosynthesis monooxygenase family protein [Paenibacillus thermotolerans]|uniref:antibiotic biosynthesis monooxygenase family protein n=1 Tax=Paenibacillus thermotolerans TaxID=3027807 RepID=UPI0023681EF6|nr:MULTISPECIES: antibiotic biosynthesis monooxygenase [unclassified Paenibacillus]
MSKLSNTPQPPYYAVIFTSERTEGDKGYAAMAERMVELAAAMPGFLGEESARDPEGFGITVSYWESLDAVKAWKEHTAHMAAQEKGKSEWYRTYALRVAKVERQSFFEM